MRKIQKLAIKLIVHSIKKVVDRPAINAPTPSFTVRLNCCASDWDDRVYSFETIDSIIFQEKYPQKAKQAIYAKYEIMFYSYSNHTRFDCEGERRNWITKRLSA